MAASSDRNPPPFPATEEPGAAVSDMADGDSDEGEDIFVRNVRGQPFSAKWQRCGAFCRRIARSCAAAS